MAESVRDSFDAEFLLGLGLNGLTNPSIRSAVEQCATGRLATSLTAAAVCETSIEESGAWSPRLALMIVLSTCRAGSASPPGLKEFLDKASRARVGVVCDM